MIMRGLDSNGDWNFGRGKNDYLSTDDAIELNIKTRLYCWVGDCFFDNGAGIDWLNRLGLKGQQEQLEQDIRRVILQSFGVSGLVSFSVSVNVQSRKINIQYNIKTIYSPSYIALVNMEL